MKCVLYSRVSTSKQDNRNQLNILRRWARRLCYEVVHEYTDQMSGARSDRRALVQLLKDAHHKKFDSVIIWSLDRLSREGIGKMAGYIEQFRSCGITLRSHEESWLSTDAPTTPLLIAIFSWIAQFERERLSHRIKAGIERALKQGKRLGRPERRIDLHKAQRLRAQGNSMRRVAEILKIPKSTLSRALSQKPHPNVA